MVGVRDDTGEAVIFVMFFVLGLGVGAALMSEITR